MRLLIATLLVLLPLSASALTIQGATKKTLRRDDKEQIWHGTNRQTTIVKTPAKFSDLGEVTIYQNFILGYSLERPSNWLVTSTPSVLAPYPALLTFQSPLDSLHTGIANLTLSRLRVDKSYTGKQFLDRAIVIFSNQIKLGTTFTSLKVAGVTAYSTDYTAASGEQGQLIVIPQPNQSFAFALLYRGDSATSYMQNKAVLDHVLKTFAFVSGTSGKRTK